MGWLSRIWVLFTLAVAGAFLGGPATAAQTDSVLLVKVDGVITPVIADHLTSAVSEAEQGGYRALLVELDTPGGLDTSMRDIVQAFLGADVPVVVYVAPAGSRAASAGAIITFSANIAAMAPGTTIGAATPVSGETGETASDKIINDAAAYAESIAQQRGRDVGFAVDTVRKGRAAPAEEAVRIGAVDLIAPDRTTLLNNIDGRAVTLANGSEVTLRTAGAPTVEYDLSGLRKLLQIIADPNLAFLFLSIGTLAVIYEAANPGMGLAGIIGAILLILGFFALSVLPFSVTGVLLLVLAAALFLAEVLTPGVGVFAAGGAIALALAGLFLFEGPVGVNPAVFLPTAAVIGVASLWAGRMAWRARSSPLASGVSTLVGSTTVVAAGGGDTGTAFVAGAWWRLRSVDGPLTAGQSVRVTGVENLTLLVEPVPPPTTKETENA